MCACRHVCTGGQRPPGCASDSCQAMPGMGNTSMAACVPGRRERTVSRLPPEPVVIHPPAATCAGLLAFLPQVAGHAIWASRTPGTATAQAGGPQPPPSCRALPHPAPAAAALCRAHLGDDALPLQLKVLHQQRLKDKLDAARLVGEQPAQARETNLGRANEVCAPARRQREGAHMHVSASNKSMHAPAFVSAC